MNKRYVRDGLQYNIELEASGGEEYEYRMLLSNDIDGLLPVRVENIDQNKKLVFQSSSYVELGQMTEKTWINARQLRGIMEAVLRESEIVRQYLLNPDSLLIDKGSLMIKEETQELSFLYLPGYLKDIRLQLRELMEYLVGKINHKDTEAVMLAWKLYMLLKEPNVDFEKLEQCIKVESKNKLEEELEKQSVMSVEEEYMEPAAPVGKKKKKSFPALPILGSIGVLLFFLEVYILYQIYYYGIEEWKRNVLLLNTLLIVMDMGILFSFIKKARRKKQLDELFYGGGIRTWEDGKTTFLGTAAGKNQPRLCRNIDGKIETIPVSFTPFCIGKDRKSADYILEESYISRNHAEINRRDNRYYIKDLHSTNGTKVNGTLLSPEQEVSLKSGDSIEVADIELLFYS